MLKINKAILIISLIIALFFVTGAANATAIPTVSLDSASYTVAENAGTIPITVSLSSAQSSSVDVNYAISGYTAINGLNYSAPLTGILTFDAGVTSKTISITIKDNVIYDVNRVFFVNLTSATGSVSLGTPNNAIVTITENDPAPTIEFYNDQFTNQVNVYEGDSAYLKAVKVSSGNGQFIPAGVAVSPSGNVYVADYFNHRIQVFDQNGNYISQFGSYGSGNGQLMYPYGIAIDSRGYIYVSDASNKITVFNPDNTYNSKFGTGLSAPKGIALDSQFRIYVADSNNNRIVVFDNNGNQLKTFGYTGYNGAGFNHPSGIAINNTDCVYVTDTNNNLIKVFGSYAANFNFISQFSTDVQAVEAPQGIMTVGDYVFVIDSYNGRILVYNNNNKQLYNWGTRGTGNGQFTGPIGIAFAPEEEGGLVFVTDFNLARVQTFDLDGNYLGQWGGPYTTMAASANYVTRDGTATQPLNYFTTNKVLTFQPNDYFKQTDGIPTVYIAGWNPTTTFYVDFTNPVNAAVGALYPTMAVNILNKDAQRTVQLSSTSYTTMEGDNATLYITMSDPPLDVPVTVTFATQDGSAVRGTDYDYSVNTVTLNPGETSKLFLIQSLDDHLYASGNKQFTVQLIGISGTSQAVLSGRTQATVTILDSPALPVIGFNVTQYNVSENAGFATLNVTLSQGYTTAVKVSYIFKDGTAVQGTNYVNLSGDLTFAPGERQKNLQVTIKDDGIINVPDLFFFANLTGTDAPVYTWGNKSAQVTINEVYYQFTINLYKGWNLISTPVVIGPLKASGLCVLNANITMVMKYDNSALMYNLYTVGAPSNYDYDFQTDYGYFVYSGKDTTVTFTGYKPSGRSVSMTKSWNMVGWSTFHTSDSSLISAMLPSLQMIMMYDGATHSYKLYTPGAPSSYIFAMGPGNGYLLYPSAPTTLNYGGI